MMLLGMGQNVCKDLVLAVASIPLHTGHLLLHVDP